VAERGAEGRKGEDGRIVNQELDCDGRAENGINLGRAIIQTHLPIKKSAAAGFWIFNCHLCIGRLRVYPAKAVTFGI